MGDPHELLERIELLIEELPQLPIGHGWKASEAPLILVSPNPRDSLTVTQASGRIELHAFLANHVSGKQ